MPTDTPLLTPVKRDGYSITIGNDGARIQGVAMRVVDDPQRDTRPDDPTNATYIIQDPSTQDGRTCRATPAPTRDDPRHAGRGRLARPDRSELHLPRDHGRRTETSGATNLLMVVELSPLSGGGDAVVLRALNLGAARRPTDILVTGTTAIVATAVPVPPSPGAALLVDLTTPSQARLVGEIAGVGSGSTPPGKGA